MSNPAAIALDIIRAGHALTLLLQELGVSREAYDRRHAQAEAEGRVFGLEDIRALAADRREAVAALDEEIARRTREG
jgi:hypothetical protein